MDPNSREFFLGLEKMCEDHLLLIMMAVIPTIGKKLFGENQKGRIEGRLVGSYIEFSLKFEEFLKHTNLYKEIKNGGKI